MRRIKDFFFPNDCNGCDHNMFPLPKECHKYTRASTDNYVNSNLKKTPSQLYLREESRRRLEIVFGISILVVVILEIIRSWLNHA